MCLQWIKSRFAARKTARMAADYVPDGTYTDEIYYHGIKSGVYGVVGPQGVGKTSFCMALLCLDYMYHGAERLQKAQKEIDLYNSQNPGANVKVPACAYRTRTKLWLPNNKPTYHTDIYQFGLPSPDFPEIQHFPKSTVIYCDEIDSALDNRAWTRLGDYKQQIFDGLKYIRHLDLAFLYDVQRFEKLDVNVRRLTTHLIYILGKKDYYTDRGELIRTEWDFVLVERQQADNAALLKELGVDISAYITAPSRCKLVYKGNIYARYNSYACKPLWYRGLKQYEIERHPESDYKQESIEQFCQQNRLKLDQNNAKLAENQPNNAGDSVPVGGDR